jgi:HEAT repeat protein
MWVVAVVAICLLAKSWLENTSDKRADESANAIRLLRTAKPAERVNAIRQVAQVGMADSARSIPAVIEALRDTDAAVRAQAAQSLGVLGSYAVWARITGAEKDQRSGSTLSAATSALLGSLAKDQESRVRAAAAGGLRNITATSPQTEKSKRSARTGRTVEPAAPPNPSSSFVDYQSITDALIGALDDPDDQVRAAAVTALGASGPKVSLEPPQRLIAALTDRSAATRTAAVGALANFPRGLDPVIPRLIQISAQDAPGERTACTRALSQIKPSAISAAAVPALVTGLKNPDRDLRFQVVSLLARLGPAATTAIPAFIATLNEPIDSDQTSMGEGNQATTVYTGPAHEAARALGEIAPGTPSAPEAIAALAEVVRAGAPQRRSSAADALAEFGPTAEAAIPDLIQMLKENAPGKNSVAERNAEVAAAALARIAAGTHSVASVITALRDALRPPARGTRVAAIRALGELGPQAAAAIPDIRALVQDRESSVRKAASKALESLEAHGP